MGEVEAARAIVRARRERRLDARSAREAERQLAAFERACDTVAMDDEVLRRAREEFPVEPVRSLDAIHLASVRVLDDALGGVEWSVATTASARTRRRWASSWSPRRSGLDPGAPP